MYEKKVRSEYSRLTNSITSRRNTIDKFSKQLREYEEELVTLEKCIRTNNEKYVINALKSAIKEINKKQAQINSSMPKEKEWLNEDNARLHYFQQYVCPHEKSDETGFDYHKRETEYTCKLCKKTW